MENNAQSPARSVTWFRMASMMQPEQPVSTPHNPERKPEKPVVSRIQTFRSLTLSPHPPSPPPVVKKPVDDGESGEATKMVTVDPAPTSPIIKRFATLRAAAARAQSQPEEISQPPMVVVPQVVPTAEVAQPSSDVDPAPTSPIIKRLATLRAAAARAPSQPEEISQLPMVVVPQVVPTAEVAQPSTDVDPAPKSPIIKRLATLRAAAARAPSQPEEISQLPMVEVPQVVPTAEVGQPITDVGVPEKAKVVETTVSTPPRSPAMRRLQPPQLPIPKRKPSLPPSPSQSPHSPVLRKKISSPPSPSPPPSPQPRGQVSLPPPAPEIKNGKRQNNGNVEKPRSPPPPLSPPPTTAKDPMTAQARKKKLSVGDNTGRMGMITMAGENTGAYMNLTGGRKESGQKQDHFNGKSHRIGPGEDLEMKKPPVEAKAARPVATAVMNNNVQGVNNSIIFHGTCSHGSPGVHVRFSRPKNPRLKKGKIPAEESPPPPTGGI